MHLGVQPFEQDEPGVRDGGDRLAPVLRVAAAPDQPLPDQAVQHAGDVRRPVDHAPRHLVPGVPIGMHAAEDAQDVVLVGRDPVAVPQRRRHLIEVIGDYQQAHDRLVGERAEPALLKALADRHGVNMCCKHVLSRAAGDRR